MFSSSQYRHLMQKKKTYRSSIGTVAFPGARKGVSMGNFAVLTIPTACLGGRGDFLLV